ncbi:unnamed protein product [Penicillium viridicatum]
MAPALSPPSFPAEGNGRYEVSETYFGQPNKVRIAIIGCGASGIAITRKIHQLLENYELVIYEKNPDVGGTWFENRYPGCACDIPSHAYQFTFAPNPEWSSFYSSASDIHRYLKTTAENIGVPSYLKLSHTVIAAEWSSSSALWSIQVRDSDGATFTDEVHFLINAAGVLNKWKWPAIAGLELFKGKLLHSARWDETIDLTEKNVGVIGGGSSAVQIVPTILPDVKSMKCFIRSPTWISGAYATKYAGKNGTNFEYTKEQKQAFRNDPGHYLAYRKGIEHELNSRFRFILKDSKEQAEIVQNTREDMISKLGAKVSSAAPHLIPNFAFGCRRPTPGNGYIEALASDKCDPIFAPIDSITERGIKTTDGTDHDFDVIICATGFDVSFKPSFPLIGLGGVNLQRLWEKQTSRSYLSLAVSGYPNYFMSLGPQSPVGHGSLLPMIEVAADNIVKMIRKSQRQGVRSVMVKERAVQDFAKYTEEFLKRTAWSDSCSSWFKNGQRFGPVVAIWPGSRLNYIEALTEPNYEDYEWEYSTKNQFQYMGNGFTKSELEQQDLTWYLDSS